MNPISIPYGLVEGDRNPSFDAMRGFAMCLVVLGHVMMFGLGIASYHNVLYSIIATIHLPIFFFISGYFVYKINRQWSTGLLAKEIFRKARFLLPPTICFFFIWCIFNDWEPIKTFPLEGFGKYWFTVALFEIFVIYFVCCWLGEKTTERIGLLVLIIISLLCIIAVPVFRNIHGIWTALSLDEMSKYFQFFVLGVICRKFQGTFNILLKSPIFRAAMIFGYFVGMICFFLPPPTTTLLSAVYWINHDLLIRYFGLFIIFLCFIDNSEWCRGKSIPNRFLQMCGKRSLDIYMIHYFFIPNLLFLGPLIEDNSLFIIQLLISLLLTGLIVLLSIAISLIIRKSTILSKYILGK